MIPKRILTNKNVAIKKCKHGYFAYYVNDLFIGRSLDQYGEWSEPEFAVLDSLISPGNIVIDVGAFIGTHSVFFGKKVFPKGFVYAFEPQRAVCNLLAANVALNNVLNVKCINMAVSKDNRTCVMPVLDPTVPQNFGGVAIDQFDQGDFIDTITIDDLPLKRCNLIKIDVEGHEANVLKGAQKTISKYQPVLYVECNRPDNSSDTLAILKMMGYKCYWHIFSYFNQKNFFKNKKNIFFDIHPEANLLCFPKDASVDAKGFIDVAGVDDNWMSALERARNDNENN